mmetsp:Transcript_52382/g.94016  ORF Transcript_52382/g.94016 Transcript_52382/m.94016 type:complete len:210 (-) Transcript_52382:1485-2114(-)
MDSLHDKDQQTAQLPRTLACPALLPPHGAHLLCTVHLGSRVSEGTWQVFWPPRGRTPQLAQALPSPALWAATPRRTVIFLPSAFSQEARTYAQALTAINHAVLHLRPSNAAPPLTPKRWQHLCFPPEGFSGADLAKSVQLLRKHTQSANLATAWANLPKSSLLVIVESLVSSAALQNASALQMIQASARVQHFEGTPLAFPWHAPALYC